MNEYKYTPIKMTPFKWFVLENFPFIEEDFDSLTSYGLWCKLKKYFDDVATKTNKMGAQVEALTNYIENLDLQDEVNNKLDEMASDGTLLNILSNYANIQRIYETVGEMIQDTSLIENQKVKCYGLANINDGFGGEFLINTSEGISLNNGLKAKFLNNYQSNFYDEIYFEREVHHNTTCYFTYIPKLDKFNKQIKLKVEKCEPLSPNEHAIKNNTNVTINASNSYEVNGIWNYGVVISDGQILNDYVFSENDIPEFYQYLGITENREFKVFPARNTTPAQMLAQGCTNVFLIFYQTVDNGVIIEHQEASATAYANKQMIGIKLNGDIVILTSDGRTLDDVGLNYEQASQLLISKGCVNCFMLDGGGSASTSFKGLKINKNFDRKGLKDRAVPYCLSIKKDIINKNIADVYGFIGSAKQNIISNILPLLPDADIITAPMDLNNLIGKIYCAYCGGSSDISNKPVSNASGYFINIPDVNVNSPKSTILYNRQIFMDYDSNIFFRDQVDGNFNEWKHLNTVKTMIYKDNVDISATGYQKIPLQVGNRKDNNLVTMIDEEGTNEKYRFSINSRKTVSINATVCLKSVNTATKYLRLVDENNTVINSLRFDMTANETTSIPFLAIMNSNPSKNYSLEYSGAVGDKLYNTLLVATI